MLNWICHDVKIHRKDIRVNMQSRQMPGGITAEGTTVEGGRGINAEYRMSNVECPMSKGMQNANAKNANKEQGTRNIEKGTKN